MVNTANKKRLVTSFNNLSTELQEKVKELYPYGYADAMMRVDKPNGDFFYAVPFETDEVSYLVKIDVKIDEISDEEDDKDFFGNDDDEINGADDMHEEQSQTEELADDVDI